MLTIPSQRALAELTEKHLDVADEETGYFHRGEVAAAIELRPVRDAIARIEDGADGRIGGEDRDAGRRSSWLIRLAVLRGLLLRGQRAICLHPLIHGVGRRRTRPGEPEDADIGEQLIKIDGLLGQFRGRICTRLKLLDDPGELTNRS